MQKTVSKAQFKAKVLEYLRMVERERQPLVITHTGTPVVEVKPYRPKVKDPWKVLRGTLVKYVDPNEPVGLEDWEALQ